MGESGKGPKYSKPAPDRLLLAVISLLGFFPVAILAILSALKVKKFNEEGDYDEAHTQARTTRDWIIISIINGIFIYFGIMSVIFIFA